MIGLWDTGEADCETRGRSDLQNGTDLKDISIVKKLWSSVDATAESENITHSLTHCLEMLETRKWLKAERDIFNVGKTIVSIFSLCWRFDNLQLLGRNDRGCVTNRGWRQIALSALNLSPLAPAHYLLLAETLNLLKIKSSPQWSTAKCPHGAPGVHAARSAGRGRQPGPGRSSGLSPTEGWEAHFYWKFRSSNIVCTFRQFFLIASNSCPIVYSCIAICWERESSYIC